MTGYEFLSIQSGNIPASVLNTCKDTVKNIISRKNRIFFKFFYQKRSG